MILMPMRQHNPAYLAAVFDQVADVGHDDVDAQQLFFRKHEPGVDDENVVADAEGHAVHAELT